MNNKYTYGTLQKHNTMSKQFALIEKEAICSLTKNENNKEKPTESIHLMVVMTRRSNYNLSLNLRKLRINKITADTIKCL